MCNKKLKVIDLFSGVGGFSSGFMKAGYDVIMANEIDPMIAESYKMNHKDTLMINYDIKEFVLNSDEIIDNEIHKLNNPKREKDIVDGLKNVDVIIGGPPCQGFSMAGARIRNKNALLEDERNYLFKYYFKMIQKYEPKYFIMENVQGMESMQGGKIINEIVRLFSDESNFRNGKYYLSKKIISANRLGVPQGRKRFIIIGSKYDKIDIDLQLELMRKKFNIPEVVTIEDAISDLNYLENNEGDFQSEYRVKPLTIYQKERRKSSKYLYNHVAPRHNDIALERIRKIGMGEKLVDKNIKSVHSGAYARLDWSEIACTITTRFDTPSAGKVIHPTQDRALTPREAARLQSFDDDFIFYGNKTSIGKQIGNAVPPLVAEVLANIILEDIKKRQIN